MDGPHPSTARPTGEVRDRRVLPQGVVPRRVQTWMMAGLSLVIITVILLTGRQTPPAATPLPGLAPASPTPERIQTFRDELTERGGLGIEPLPPETEPPVGSALPTPTPAGSGDDPLTQERRRREYESLFAANVAFSTREGAAPRSPQPAGMSSPVLASPLELAAFRQALVQPLSPPPAPPATQAAGGGQAAEPSPGPSQPPDGLRIVEGTVIEAVLLNRLDGTFSGPVTCLVTTPVYSENRQAVLIPAGARLLGTAEAVDTWGESRLAVSFHRLLLPNGESATLDQFRGLNQVGETGLKDQVDRHYLQVFGASVAIGALSGLAQWNTRGFSGDFGDASRQSAGASLATSSGRVLDRYLNVLPTVTIREGHRIKVYLTNDLHLPVYSRLAPAHAALTEGVS